MPIRAFDTMSVADTLQDAGFEAEKARALVAVVSSVQDDFATKDDLNAFESRIRGSTSKARAESKADNTALMATIHQARAEARADSAILNAAIHQMRVEAKADTVALRVAHRANISALRFQVLATVISVGVVEIAVMGLMLALFAP